MTSVSDILDSLRPVQGLESLLATRRRIAVPAFPGATLSLSVAASELESRGDAIASALETFFSITSFERVVADEVVAHAQPCARYAPERVSALSPENALQHLEPTCLRVQSGHDGKLYVRVDAECSWDVEHGLSLVFREDGTFVRVTEQSMDAVERPRQGPDAFLRR